MKDLNTFIVFTLIDVWNNGLDDHSLNVLSRIKVVICPLFNPALSWPVAGIESVTPVIGNK